MFAYIKVYKQEVTGFYYTIIEIIFVRRLNWSVANIVVSK